MNVVVSGRRFALEPVPGVLSVFKVTRGSGKALGYIQQSPRRAIPTSAGTTALLLRVLAEAEKHSAPP